MISPGLLLSTFFLCYVHISAASDFKLVQSWEGDRFLQGWNFFSEADPTHGDVSYVNETVARRDRLAYTNIEGNTIIRVDNSSYLTEGQPKRKSVRLTSREPMKVGSLFVLDVDHLPFGDSVWPAIWSLGGDWPNGGEIDIVEGVHQQSHNHASIHTSNGCRVDNTSVVATGEILFDNCYSWATPSNLGCGVKSHDPKSFGDGFNKEGGGVFGRLLLPD